WVALAVIPLIALWGIAAPAIQTLMSRCVDHSAQGRLQGAINSLRALTGMAGPLLFTQIFSLAIAPKSRLRLPAAPTFAAGLLLFSSAALASASTRTHPVPAPADPCLQKSS